MALIGVPDTIVASTAEELRHKIRDALRQARSPYTGPDRCQGLATSLFGDVTAARAREALLGLLAERPNPWVTRELAEAIAGLDPTAEDRARAREALLGLLPGESWRVQELAEAIAGLDPTSEERARARKALLGLLACEIDPSRGRELMEVIARLAVTEGDRAQARQALLSLLASQAHPRMIRELAEAVARLTVTAEDRAQVRQVLLGLLAGQADSLRAGNWRRRTPGWTRPRRTGRAPVRCCSACSPPKSFHGRPGHSRT